MILITGGAGFIGSNFVKYFTKQTTDKVVVVDSLTYASDLAYLDGLKIEFIKSDISDDAQMDYVFSKHNIKKVINFAAESHVDRSIYDPSSFIQSNIIGTVNLLNKSLKYEVEKFLQISTDEVFGDIDKGWFYEGSQINPRNPYSASKASAEHFVNAYNNTYGLPTTIINSSNNYGPHQFPEKLIPLTIKNLLSGKKVPIYGDGQQIRDWLYVEDNCEIIFKIFEKGLSGERYCVGGDMEVANIELVKTIIKKLGLKNNMIEYVKDRPGHDKRYATDIYKVREEFCWEPKTSLEDGLDKTIEWVKQNENRLQLQLF